MAISTTRTRRSRAVPGAFVPPNQQGWDQTVYIRGGNYDQVGYEFDGVPVNRSFDNYPGSTAGTLGQQELQVYTGGGTAAKAPRAWPVSSIRSSRPEHIPDMRRSAPASARRRTITTCRSKSAERRRTATSRTTSGSAATTKISAISISSTEQSRRRVGLFVDRRQHDQSSVRRRLSDVFLQAARIAANWYDGPNGSPVYNPFGYATHPSHCSGALHENPGCYRNDQPGIREVIRT